MPVSGLTISVPEPLEISMHSVHAQVTGMLGRQGVGVGEGEILHPFPNDLLDLRAFDCIFLFYLVCVCVFYKSYKESIADKCQAVEREVDNCSLQLLVAP